MKKGSITEQEFWVRTINAMKDLNCEDCTTPDGHKFSYMLSREGHEQYENLLSRLMKFSNLSELYSAKTIKRKVQNVITTSIESDEPISHEIIEHLLNDVHGASMENKIVIRQLYGGHFSSASPLKLGPYIIYRFPDHWPEIEKSFPKASKFKIASGISYYVQTSVETKDSQLAMEIGSIGFDRCVNILNFLLTEPGSDEYISLYPVVTYGDEAVRVLSETSGSIYWLSFGTGAVDLTDIVATEEFAQAVWKAAENETPSKFERRLLMAIDWIGIAVVDRDPGRAYLQLVFAIEVIMQMNIKEMIKPSISALISEGVAFILGETKEDREKFHRRIKHAYSLRSKIVHGEGIRTVTPDELWLLYDLVRELIAQFFLHPEISQIRSSESLRKFIEDKKFS